MLAAAASVASAAVAQPTPETPRSRRDITLSVTVLVLTVLLGAAAAVVGLVTIAFLDYCPPESCSADDAFSTVTTTLAIAALIGLAGGVITVVRLNHRRKAWPIAAGTFALCALTFAVGAAAYQSVVGW